MTYNHFCNSADTRTGTSPVHTGTATRPGPVAEQPVDLFAQAGIQR